MSYTYNLSGTLNTGKANSINDDKWSSGFTNDTEHLGSVGYDGRYYVTNILFNYALLYSLRGATIESITLTLTPGALERNMRLIGCYKLNNISTDWTRSDKDSTQADASASSVLFDFNPNGHTSQFTISNVSGMTTVPKYGLVIGPYSSSIGSRWIFTAATLNVTTNETQYSYTLSYNANSGSGAPGNQTASNIQVTASYTFTISNTIPTRTGYEFLGWSTSSTATTASYQPGGTITVSNGTTTLYAVWKRANTVRIVNGSSLDTYLVYVVENNVLVPYRVTVANGTSLDPYS